MQPQMFFPGQQPAFLPPNARGGMPGMPGFSGGPQGQGRGGFPGGMPQQGRGGGPGQQIPPQMYGMMPNMPPGGFPPNAYGPAYMQQLQQAAQQAMGGRGGGGRGGPMGMMPGMQQMPGAVPAMRGGNASGFPPQQGGPGGRGGPSPAVRQGQVPGQAPGIPAGGRGANGPQGAAPGGLDMQQLQSLPAPQRKQMLGEALYPKIAQQEPELAGKITGMLLEMDDQELLNLTQDEGALKAKVLEAMSVYDDYIKTKGKDDDGKENGEAKPEEAKA